MFESKANLFAIGEDELIEVVEYELQGLWIGLIYLNDLRDAACVEGLILDIAEIAEYLLYLVLH